MNVSAPRLRPIRADMEFTRAEIGIVTRHLLLNSRALPTLGVYAAVAIFFAIVAASDARDGDAHAAIEGAIAIATITRVATAIPRNVKRTWAKVALVQPIAYAFSEDGLVVSVPGGRTSFVPWSGVPGHVVIPKVGYALTFVPNPVLLNRRCIPAGRVADFDGLLARKTVRRTRYR